MKWFCILFICLCCSFILRASKPSVKKVMIFNSYHKGFAWTDQLVEGIKKSFSDNDMKVEFYVEYMDTKRFYDDKYLKALKELYQKKYSTKQIDLIISSDDNALNFLKANQGQVFKKVPVVFCGIDRLSEPKVVDRKRFTGVLEHTSIKPTLELIKKLHPNVRNIYVIADQTPTCKARVKQVKELADDFKRFTFQYPSNYNLEAIWEDVKNLKKNSVVLLLGYWKDPNGKFFEYKEFMDMLNSVNPFPVYCISSNYMGHGVVGGCVNDGTLQGMEAAEKACQILNGKKVSDIDITIHVDNPYMLDYQQVERFDIDYSAFPGNIKFINKPQNILDFYREHKAFVLTLFSSFLLIVIVILSWATIRIISINKSRAKLIKKLETAMAEIKTLSGFIPICCNCKKIRDDKGYWEVLEEYITEHSEAKLSHSICPDCLKDIYPEYSKEKELEGCKSKNHVKKA